MKRLVASMSCGLVALLSGASRAESVPDGSAGDEGEPDAECLQWLVEHDVKLTRAPLTRGVRTPIEVQQLSSRVQLVPLGRRAALMDCELARALVEAAPIFGELGISELVYSAAYDYRTRRDSPRLSGHAHGLAIDVHVFRGPGHQYQVERDFEAGVGEWRSMGKAPVSEEVCIGAPVTEAGRTLRTLACRLKVHPAFRVIVTHDDNEDHRNHFHLESYPDLLSRSGRRVWNHAGPRAAPEGSTSDGVSVAATEAGGHFKQHHEKKKKKAKPKPTTKKKRHRKPVARPARPTQ